MGGWGSGRYSRRRTRLDDLLAVDVRRLRRQGRLEPGYDGTAPTSRGGREVGDVFMRRHGGVLVLRYGLAVEDGTREETVEDRVPLLRTAQPGGGERPWFACPGCGRRCAVLYRAPRFRCRACVGATYASQYVSKGGRPFHRARAIRVRLGGADSLLEPFPPKPKRMRWATYLRLAQEARECMHAAFEETDRQIVRLLKEVEAIGA
jgi:hypothetical protein